MLIRGLSGGPKDTEITQVMSGRQTLGANNEFRLLLSEGKEHRGLTDLRQGWEQQALRKCRRLNTQKIRK